MLVTERVASLRGVVLVDATYDDSSLALSSIVVTNNSDRSVTVTINRSSGQAWQDRVLPPGSQTFTPGGPVQSMTDLGRFQVGLPW